MYAVDVTLAPGFRAGQPRLLFAGAFPNIPGFDFAIAPGGREFLMLENEEFSKPQTRLTVIGNVVEEVERRESSRSR
jgi:hypothetical protein